MSRPVVIVVSGSGSKSGKTLLVEKLIPCFPDCTAVKAHPAEDIEFVNETETDPPRDAGKDTARFIAAGARRAVYLHGPSAEVLAALRVMAQDESLMTLLVESNLAARELHADLVFFVEGSGVAKPGVEECRRRADVVVKGMDAIKTENRND